MSELSTDLNDLAVAMASATVLDDLDRRLAIGLYRALAEGRPVSVAALAERCGLERSRVADTLSTWPGVFVDDTGGVVGFWGLALSEMAHGYVVGGRRLYTWCAFDALFITPILDQVAEVSSRCPVTGRPVSLTVGPEGIRRAEPAETVMSFLPPRQPFDGDVITTFCHYVLFFASPEAGRQWVDGHPGTFLLDLGEAFTLGRRYNTLRLGAALESDQPT